MPEYRRYYRPGGTYFFTVVTWRRRRFLTTPLGRSCMRHAISSVRAERPFKVLAQVLLPNHWHVLLELPQNDDDFSTRIGLIKTHFTKSWREQGGFEPAPPNRRRRENRSALWQPRFWEHAIRDIEDLNTHEDYIHFNPVRHGEVRCPHDWQWSTFDQAVRDGRYEQDWCCSCVESVDAPVFDRLPLDRME